MGYLAGLAITIVIGQLPKLFGYSTDADGLRAEFTAWLGALDQTNAAALLVGVLCLGLIVGLRRFAPRVPGVLVAVVGAIIVSTAFDLAARGVSVVGILPQGFPRPSLPTVGWTNLVLLFAAAVGISLVAIGDTISTSAGFAARKGYEVNSNQELLGIGTANLLAGVFQGFPVSTSGSRTAVAEQSGAQTQLTGLVAAGAVLAMIVFLPGLVRNLPQSALAAIIIAASMRLFDVAEFRRLLVMRPSEFWLAVASLLGVAFVGVLEGIVIAVVLSVLDFFRRAWQPYSAVLGRVDGMEGYHDVSRYPNAHQIPGLVILRWNAPLFFANGNLFRDLIRQLVAQSEPKPFWILVSAEPVTDIDTSAADVLVDLDMELNSQGIHLVFAEMKDPVKDKIIRYGLLETIDQRHFYATIETAVAAFHDEVMIHRPELLGQDQRAAPAGGS